MASRPEPRAIAATVVRAGMVGERRWGKEVTEGAWREAKLASEPKRVRERLWASVFRYPGAKVCLYQGRQGMLALPDL